MRADATIQIRLQTVKVITKHFLGHEAQHVPRLLKWLGTESHQILDCMRQTIFFVLVLSFFLTSSSGCSRVNGLVPCSVIYRVIAARSYKRPYSAKTGPRKYSWVMGQIKLWSSSDDIVWDCQICTCRFPSLFFFVSLDDKVEFNIWVNIIFESLTHNDVKERHSRRHSLEIFQRSFEKINYWSDLFQDDHLNETMFYCAYRCSYIIERDLA